MFEFIKGKLVNHTPAYTVLENSGIGYVINISLNTYTQLQGKTECQLYIHQVIREDLNALYGFYTNQERDIFRHLINVSGIGANTARVILSSMNPTEVRDAILSGNVAQLQSVKGIGTKTAQRAIIDLKDKIGKSTLDNDIFVSQNNTIKDEALSALVMLGFAKKSADKILDKNLIKEPNISVEELIKKALKQL